MNKMDAQPGKIEEKQGFPWRWAIAIPILAAIFAAWFLLPVQMWLNAFTHWVNGLGAWGYPIFGLAYIIGTLTLEPGSILTVTAGVAFGGWAFPLVVVSATIGASLSFLVGRYVAREQVKAQVEKRPRFRAVDKAVSEDGWKIVALLRLSPLIPFNLQNYFFGITDVGFWHYLLATFFGIMPGTALYIYLGALGHAAAKGGTSAGGHPLKWVFLGVGLIATAVVAILISKKAKIRLDEIEDEHERQTMNAER